MDLPLVRMPPHTSATDDLSTTPAFQTGPTARHGHTGDVDYTPVGPDAFSNDPRLADWQIVGHAAQAWYSAGSFSAAAELLLAIARLADELDHHPDLDLRYPDRVGITFSSHVTGGLTQADVIAAAQVSALAGDRGATVSPPQA
jgi:4a-hydroxytetrahydrobiopterin dehydratase